jgi:hypothetical protein
VEFAAAQKLSCHILLQIKGFKNCHKKRKKAKGPVNVFFVIIVSPNSKGISVESAKMKFKNENFNEMKLLS